MSGAHKKLIFKEVTWYEPGHVAGMELAMFTILSRKSSDLSADFDIFGAILF